MCGTVDGGGGATVGNIGASQPHLLGENGSGLETPDICCTDVFGGRGGGDCAPTVKSPAVLT